MAGSKIDVGMFAKTVVDILSKYAETTTDSVNRATDEVSKEAVKKLKETSPKKSGEYAKAWTRQKDSKSGVIEYTVYNSRWGGRTHVLEKGHVVRPTPKHPGKKTRVEGREHIAPVDDWVSEELMRKVEKDI